MEAHITITLKDYESLKAIEKAVNKDWIIVTRFDNVTYYSKTEFKELVDKKLKDYVLTEYHIKSIRKNNYKLEEELKDLKKDFKKCDSLRFENLKKLDNIPFWIVRIFNKKNEKL